MSPQAQAQMGPPGGPGFGDGIAGAQQAQGKSPEEIAVGTCEKILMGIQNETMRPYVQKCLATLKIGLAQVQQAGPESQGMNKPPSPNAPPAAGPSGPPPGPPGAGAMPG